MPNKFEDDFEDELQQNSAPGHGGDATKEFDEQLFERTASKRRRSSSLLGGLALLLALGALGLSGMQWWAGRDASAVDAGQISGLTQQQARLQQDFVELSSRVDAAESNDSDGETAALRALVDQQTGVLEQFRKDLEAQRAYARTLQTALEAVQARLLAAETSLAAKVPQALDGAGQLDLAEVDYLLRLASERLRLFRDVRSADRALALADSHLTGLDNPMYLGVRQHITQARAALNSVEWPNEVELSATIDKLQENVLRLAFADKAGAPSQENIGGDSGWWGRLKRSLASLVTVRRTQEAEARLTIEDKELIRQGLWMQLESARLAMMRHDEAAWQDALLRTVRVLDRWFQSDEGDFGDIRTALETLAQTNIAPDVPDISGPWAQLQLLRRAPQPAPNPPDEPASNGNANRETPSSQGGDEADGEDESA